MLGYKILVIAGILVSGEHRVPVEIADIIAACVVEESSRQGVDMALVLGIMEVESGFNPMPRDSGKGCVGLMQINPRYWERYDVYSLHGNIYWGVKIINNLQKQGFTRREVLKRYHGLGSDGKYEAKVLTKIKKWEAILRK